MGLVIEPLVLNAAFPVIRVCVSATFRSIINVRAVYLTRCKMNTCVNSPNLCVPQHDTRQLVIDFIDSNATPYDVSDATEITFIIARNVRSAPLFTKLKSDGGITITNDTQGRLSLTAADTGALPIGTNYYECKVFAADGNVATVLSGVFTVQDTRIGDV